MLADINPTVVFPYNIVLLTTVHKIIIPQHQKQHLTYVFIKQLHVRIFQIKKIVLSFKINYKININNTQNLKFYLDFIVMGSVSWQTFNNREITETKEK